MKPLYLYIILLYTVNTVMAQERAGQVFSHGMMKGSTTAGRNQQRDSLNKLICYSGLPYAHQKKICQDLFIKNDAVKVKAITIACFDITDERDSIEVYSVRSGVARLEGENRFTQILT